MPINTFRFRQCTFHTHTHTKMEIYSPVVPAVKDVKRLDEIRKSAKFQPSIWGDFFLAFDSHNTQISETEEEEAAKQKEAVGKLLAQTLENPTYKMELIDLIQRLGVDYHFEKEIDEFLKYIHENSSQDNEDDDLRTTALRFRLLRQQGYHVPCDIFCKFTDGEGNFMEPSKESVEGLLELYEASHLATRGEEILDRAMEFSSSHLQALLDDQMVGSVSLSKRVEEALKMPIRKTLTRLGARKFLSLYQEDESHNELLLNFAKLDFNMVQKMHQRELSDATRWWKKLEVANRMPYARDRVVECFFWIVGVYFEPCYATARRILIKAINMASIIDDTYEYATLDELQTLTDAIQRWDVNETLEDSPPYVQMCYKALIQAYAEIEDEIVEKFGGEASYRVQYAIEHVKQSAMAYFEEAKWIYDNSVPTMEEYMKVSLVTCGYMMLATTSLVGVGSDRVSKADFDWIVNEPLIVRASCVICRLMDDIVGDEYEEKPSSVLCYMKQYGASKDEARARLQQLVKDAWKDMNGECIEPLPASVQILTRVLNLGRVINLLYREKDCYSDPTRSKEWVKMVLVDPI